MKSSVLLEEVAICDIIGAGETVKEEKQKVSVVATNKPSQLLFMVPQMPAGIYQMVVVTDISPSGNKLKSQVEISSGPLEVREGLEVSFIGFY
ncbi:MAG: DUF4469 domain-containing protein [Treponema sp.]|nr:DUF4469 domain-containing protein [Treponema sp.]